MGKDPVDASEVIQYKTIQRWGPILTLVAVVGSTWGATYFKLDAIEHAQTAYQESLDKLSSKIEILTVSSERSNGDVARLRDRVESLTADLNAAKSSLAGFEIMRDRCDRDMTSLLSDVKSLTKEMEFRRAAESKLGARLDVLLGKE